MDQAPSPAPRKSSVSVGPRPTREDDEYRSSRRSYYSIAHAILEPVTEQASMMVYAYGKLKEYQV